MKNNNKDEVMKKWVMKNKIVINNLEKLKKKLREINELVKWNEKEWRSIYRGGGALPLNLLVFF
jgi:hypothetical protein